MAESPIVRVSRKRGLPPSKGSLAASEPGSTVEAESQKSDASRGSSMLRWVAGSQRFEICKHFTGMTEKAVGSSNADKAAPPVFEDFLYQEAEEAKRGDAQRKALREAIAACDINSLESATTMANASVEIAAAGDASVTVQVAVQVAVPPQEPADEPQPPQPADDASSGPPSLFSISDDSPASTPRADLGPTSLGSATRRPRTITRFAALDAEPQLPTPSAGWSVSVLRPRGSMSVLVRFRSDPALYHHRVLLTDAYSEEGDRHMALTPDRRVRPLAVTEAELLDVLLYSEALPTGVRSEDCYRDVDTAAGLFQKEEIAGALRVGQSNVDALRGAPRRALSDDVLRIRAGLQADSSSGLVADSRGVGESPLLRFPAGGGPAGAPGDGTPQDPAGAGYAPLPFVDPGAAPGESPRDVPLGIPTPVAVDDSAELAASRAVVVPAAGQVPIFRDDVYVRAATPQDLDAD